MANAPPSALPLKRTSDVQPGKVEFAPNAQKDGISTHKMYVCLSVIFAQLGMMLVELARLATMVILFQRESVLLTTT